MRPALATLIVALGLLAGGCALTESDEGAPVDPNRPPQLGIKSDDEESVEKLGFPSLATANTTRIGGGDAAADAAGVTSAIFPATSASSRPDAVVLVDGGDWQGAVTASVLASRPIGAAMLLSDGDELPAVTEDTLERLKPKGSDLSKDAQVIRIGERPPAPKGLRTAVIRGDDPYARGAAIDRFSSAARGEPSDNVVIASGERSEWAMPAAAWAARSGDSVLLAAKDRLPVATRRAVEAHQRPQIFILGPDSVIGPAVARALSKLGRVRRIEAPTPVQGAIAFARYRTRGFGWGVKLPGSNFTIASTRRPADAAAAAGLASARGVFAPLLLTDQPDPLPRSLEGYLLDIQPGFEDDPRDAVYNHAWLLGDDRTISVRTQARVNEIAALVPVRIREP